MLFGMYIVYKFRQKLAVFTLHNERSSTEEILMKSRVVETRLELKYQEGKCHSYGRAFSVLRFANSFKESA